MGARNVGVGPRNLDYRLLDHLHRILRQVQEVQSTIGPVYGDSANLPNVYYVDSGSGSDTNDGRDPGAPMATIDAAIARCTAGLGDIILVQPGHSETLAAAITVDVADVSIIGVGEGTNRPQLTVAFAGDGITITAANARVENLYFNEATAAATSDINIAAANAVVKGCHFDAGANDDELITITADGDGALIEDSEFVVTANGPDIAVEIEAAGVDGLVVRHNLFNGMSVANAWDEGVVHSGVAHTRCVIENNIFLYMAANIGGVEFSAAATGIIRNNAFGLGTLGQMLDPGSCACFENYEQDAIDESGRLFPTVNPDDSGVAEVLDQLSGAAGIASFPNAAVPADAVSLAEVLRSTWASLQGTAAGENGITTWPAQAAPGDAVSIAEALRYNIDQQNYRMVTRQYSFVVDGGVAGSIAMFTVTGAVEVILVGVVTTSLTSGGAATLEAGVVGLTAALIANTAVADLSAPNTWVDASPAIAQPLPAAQVISSGQDIVFDINVADLTAGIIDFYCYWRPLGATGAVVAA